MQVKKLLRVLFCFLPLFSMNSHGLSEFASYKSLKDAPYILGQTHGDFLVYDERQWAGAVIFVTILPFKETVKTVRKVIEEAFGIEVVEIHSASSFQAIFDDMGLSIRDSASRSLWKSHWETETADLKKAGFIVDGFQRYFLKTKRYNEYSNRQAFSTFSIHVMDSFPMFGKTGAVIISYRVDQAMEWWRESVHSLFSFSFKLRLVQLLTNAEIALLKSWADGTGLPYKMIAIGSNPVTSYQDEWHSVKRWFMNPTFERPKK